jgi:hypothetical protein
MQMLLSNELLFILIMEVFSPLFIFFLRLDSRVGKTCLNPFPFPGYIYIYIYLKKKKKNSISLSKKRKSGQINQA